MSTDPVVQYLTKQKSAAKNEVAESWHKLHELYAKKLWHPLTTEVRTLVTTQAFIEPLNLKEFYDSFVSTFENRINSFHLVEIALPVAQFLFSKNRQDAYDFLGKVRKTVEKDKLAVARARCGEIELRLMHKDTQDRIVDISKDMLDSTQKEIDHLIGVTDVHPPFYKVSAQYLREIGNFAGYYREALRYLGVEDINKLSHAEKRTHAFLIGFAALLGENVYNFGELLCHPILQDLKDTDDKWLMEALYAFNSGDIAKFYLMEKQWASFSDLAKRRDFLIGKLRLMTMMEIALARPSKERNISFNEIATKCQAEFLAMKALSKDLIKGSIDQVNQTLLITWVQPRVLNPQQILTMASRISSWRSDVASMGNIVNEHAKEILTKPTEIGLIS